MLSKKLKVVYAMALLLGCLNVAFATCYDTACYRDAYSKFSNCCQKSCPDYPDQFFPNGHYIYNFNA